MNDIFAKASCLKDLVSYQDGAVVSKEILKKDNSSLTLFAFDKGQGLSEHSAPFDAFVYIVDGVAEVTISKIPTILKAGEAVIMPANKPHSLAAHERFKMLLVMLRA